MELNARCLAHLDAGGLILTADLRQARILRRLHDRAQIAAGRDAWPTAQVLPLDAWLSGAWREAGAAQDRLPRVLPPLAMRWLWRRIVVADAPSLLDTAEVAARARLTWLQLHAHGGDIAGLARWPLTRDQQSFVGWARALESELARSNACDGADLARSIVAKQALPAPAGPLLLAGFSRPTPAQAALFEALAGRGWRIERLAPARTQGRAWLHPASDPASERSTLIAWLRERLVERPEGLHALIVPDLASHRGELERALEAALQPALELPGGPRERVFDLAGGPPLAAYAVIGAALDVVQSGLGLGDWKTSTRLLRSSCLAPAAGEQDARVRLDVRLRSEGRSHPADATALGREARAAGAPHFAAALGAARAVLAGAPRRSAGAWAEAFGGALATWGWARGVAPESSDWQAANRFGEMLRELAALGAFARDLTAAQALAELREIVATPFQPESGEPSVFVLDGWEDPGLDFDSLWVAGLTATAFPGPARVDPFLPIEVQRRFGMPRATAESCIEDAQAVLAAWRTHAAALVLSWPAHEDDTDADASPLLPERLPSLPTVGAFALRTELQRGAAVLEGVAEDSAPALDGGRAPGGARVLELQSACPFRAFGELRLHARPLEEPQAGFDRRLRGQVLHRALERFWSDLGSQDALLALGPDACERRVADAVEQALAASEPAAIGARAIALEREWQRGAIGQLLALERERRPFTVTETERELTGRIGGLELALRVDRVDETEGALVVIDYKTGATRGPLWRGARMDAPQLPLYAVLHPLRPAAIVLAEAGAAGARFLGVGDESVAIDGVLPAERFALTEDKEKGFGWRAVTERWWAWLDALGRDHAAGRAIVDPKLAADTCRRCHLGALCRVDPAGAREALQEEAEDGA